MSIKKHKDFGITFVLYIILAVLTFALMIVAIIGSSGKTDIFNSKIIYVILGALAISTLIGIVIFDPKFTVKTFGFYLLHMGIIIFLLGQLIYSISGYKVNVSISEDDPNT